ncbi:hypothetical protein F5887DRAFT_936970 [Amanita rubescens]|nr:hypothetical protein F5887DRAFT_936970 [Amanita rubescens]
MSHFGRPATFGPMNKLAETGERSTSVLSTDLAASPVVRARGKKKRGSAATIVPTPSATTIVPTPSAAIIVPTPSATTDFESRIEELSKEREAWILALKEREAWILALKERDEQTRNEYATLQQHNELLQKHNALQLQHNTLQIILDEANFKMFERNNALAKTYRPGCDLKELLSRIKQNDPHASDLSASSLCMILDRKEYLRVQGNYAAHSASDVEKKVAIESKVDRLSRKTRKDLGHVYQYTLRSDS